MSIELKLSEESSDRPLIEPVSIGAGGGQKSVNFGPGVEMLMNPSKQNKSGEPKANITLSEIDDLNDLKIAEQIFKPSLEQIKSFHGGYWKYDIVDFHYLVNLYFPTQEMIYKIKEKFSKLIECYPSTQKIITELFSKWKNKPYFNKENLIITNFFSFKLYLSKIFTSAVKLSG